jgi:ribosomal protein S12 methylthiotransferase accessory factor
MTAAQITISGRVASAMKIGGEGVHRTRTAAETCRRMEPLLDTVGVTRIADITGLDHIGIPVYSCTRPCANRHSVSVTCGKGASRAQARAGAIMEAIEYHCAEPGGIVTRRASYQALAHEERTLDPADLVLPVWSPYRRDRALEWVRGWELLTGEEWWLPANSVFHPYLPSAADSLMILRGSTNGLASGNVPEEAICHALAELIERDSWSLCWVRVKQGRGDDYPGVDLTGADPSLRSLVRRFERAGIELYMRDITSDLGVPAYYAATLEEVGHGILAHEGMGAHPDARVALARALTEAAQSRAADIQGSREDISYWRSRAGNGKVTRTEWSLTRPSFSAPLAGNSGVRNADIRDDIAWMVARLQDAGLDRIFVVDLSRPGLDVPVVRVIVPGLEFVAIDEYRVGPRAWRAAAGARQSVSAAAS